VNNRLIRYDGVTGNFDGILAQGGLLSNPADIKRGADGRLYIASALQDRIAVYDTTNSTMNSFVQDPTFKAPVGLAFGPDGDLFVASFTRNKVVRVNHATHLVIGDYIAEQSGGLNGPQFLTFIPEPSLLATALAPLVLNTRRRRYQNLRPL